MNRILEFNELRCIKLREWRKAFNNELAGSENEFNLFIFACGYESRSIYFHSKIPRNDKIEAMVFGFEENKDVLSRKQNEEYFNEKGLDIISVSTEDCHKFFNEVTEKISSIISKSPTLKLNIHIDYSSMPRSWYCNFPVAINSSLRSFDNVFFWYTPGDYKTIEYPTAGINDFKKFSGSPTPNATFRTHFLGLGFDKIRSQAIWSVLDPQYLVCYYADPTVKKSYVAKVKKDNRDVLNSTQHVFTLPLDDFTYIFSRIRSLVYDFRRNGDVIIVPDGPKPLILASSLIPFTMDYNGVTCIHVTRRRDPETEPVDVEACSDPIGFMYNVYKSN